MDDGSLFATWQVLARQVERAIWELSAAEDEDLRIIILTPAILRASASNGETFRADGAYSLTETG